MITVPYINKSVLLVRDGIIIANICLKNNPQKHINGKVTIG